MRVIAFNGSPRAEGNTAHALRTVMGVLAREGIETELIQVGNQAMRSCMACGMCARNRDERCVLPDDGVNDWIQKMKQADGILLGTPVHYSNLTGAMKCFLDRAFYVCGMNGGLLRHKVGAAVAAVRRSGGIPAMDALTRYITYSEMIMPGSNYWNVVHGRTPGEVEKDEEGMQIMRLLGENMAWVMKLKEYAATAVPAPAGEQKILTSFIR